MKICPSCGSRYEGNERFCPNDGDELAVYSDDQPGSWSGKTVGTFTLGALLSDSPVGELYRVEGDSATVVKLIKPAIGTHKAQTGNFEADLEAAARIDHADLARCRAFQLETEPRYVAWQHLDGAVPLAEIIREGGPIPERAAFLLAARVASDLGVLHGDRVFHRNLHPGAILLAGINHQTLRKDPDSILAAPTLVTFWAEAHLVRVKDPIEAHAKNAKGFYGYAEYLSPEQAQGRAADERTDIYALGVVLYEALTGKAPFTSGSFTTTLKRQIYEKPLLPRIARPGLKLERHAEDLVVRMLAKRPEERFDSTTKLLEAMAAAGFALPIEPAHKRAPSDASHSTRALSRAEIKEMLAKDGSSAQEPADEIEATTETVHDKVEATQEPADAQTPDEAVKTQTAQTGSGDQAAREVLDEDADAASEAVEAAEADAAPAGEDGTTTPALALAPHADVSTDASPATGDDTGTQDGPPGANEEPSEPPADAAQADDAGGCSPGGADVAAEGPVAAEPDARELEADEAADDAADGDSTDGVVVAAKGSDAEPAVDDPEARLAQTDEAAEEDRSGELTPSSTSEPSSAGTSRKRSRKKRGRQKSGKTAPPPEPVPMAASAADAKSEPTSSAPSGGVTELRGRPGPTPLTAPISGESQPKHTRPIKNGRNGVGNGVLAEGAELDLHGEEWFADGATADVEPAATEDESTGAFAGRYNIVFVALVVLLLAVGVGGSYVISQSAGQAEHKDQDARAAAHEKKTESDRQLLFKQFDDALASGRALPPAENNAISVLRQLKLNAGVGSTEAYRKRETSFLAVADKEMHAEHQRGDTERAQLIAQLILSMTPENAEAQRILALSAPANADAGVTGSADPGSSDDTGAAVAAPDAEAVANQTPDAGAMAVAAIEDKGPSPEQLAADQKAEQEAARRAEEEARLQAEGDARNAADEEAKRKREEEARIKAEAQASKLAQADARKAAEEDARKRAAEDAAAKKKDEDARKADAQRKREADAAAKAEAARKAKADAAAKKDDAARKKAEAARKREEARKKKDEDARGDRAQKREEAKRLMKLASGQSGAAALATYRKVVAIDPSNHRAHFNIGVKLSEQGDFSGALRYLERAVKLQGRSSHYRLRLANAYFKTGNQAKAKAQYQKVLTLDPENRAAKAMLSRF